MGRTVQIDWVPVEGKSLTTWGGVPIWRGNEDQRPSLPSLTRKLDLRDEIEQGSIYATRTNRGLAGNSEDWGERYFEKNHREQDESVEERE
jgi:hypothetical protein